MHRVHRKRATLIAACLAWIGICSAPAESAEYLDARDLGRELRRIARGKRAWLRVSELAESLGGREVWLAELGAGSEEERAVRPAVLVVAGAEGNDLIGSASALEWVRRLAEAYEEDEEIERLLDRTTIYVVPRLNPDGAEGYFASPRVETALNTLPIDEDHDGLIDEDGPEDLNGDGIIAHMRIEDPEGEYILDPQEERLLIKADAAKGEAGAWRYLAEGRDDDGDERWGEDGPGGVNFNRNFPYNYRFFDATTGMHQVSEPPTRALADFVVEHPNIGIVFTFGAADNLLKAPQAEKASSTASSGAGRRPSRRAPTGWNAGDLTYLKNLGEVYRENLGLKKELTGSSEPGTFSDWMYFHRGRLSLAARPWSPALALELEKVKPEESEETEEKETEPAEEAKDPKAEKGDKRGGGDAPDKRGEDERAYLKWIEENAPEAFVPWEPFDHPDFPGQRAEIGGYAPFAMTNPPEALADDLIEGHGDFLTDLAGRLPRVGFRSVESRHLGKSVYEITIEIENTGYLPTVLAHGERTREVHPTRVTIDLGGEAFLSGAARSTTPTLAGSGGSSELRYIIHAPGKKEIELEVISMLGGRARATLALEGEEN